jgi:AcrR family transcriptional regulator
MLRSGARTREHVLETAHALFYWNGIRATGVDTVAQKAQVAPTTLYRLFASKDDLVRAYVERADAQNRNRVDAVMAAADADPRTRILAFFDSLNDQVQPERCRGCAFLMTLAEFPDPALPAHRAAVAAKAWARDHVYELVRDFARGRSVPDEAALADHLVLLMEGVHASSQALGAHGPAGRATAIVEGLLDQFERPSTRSAATTSGRRKPAAARRA